MVILFSVPGVLPRGYPLSFQIFNIVVDVIVRHWFGIVLENEDFPDRFLYTISDKEALFYTYDELIASTNPVWLQWVFDKFIGLFGRVGIITNVGKMVEMVFKYRTTFRKYSKTTYGLHMNIKLDPHCVKQRWMLVCGECGAELAMAYMVAHLQTQHIW